MKEIELTIQLLAKYGIMIVMLGYFIWKDFRRETQVFNLVKSLTDYLNSKNENEEKIKSLEKSTDDNRHRITTLEKSKV
jgi:hypothetical protein